MSGGGVDTHTHTNKIVDLQKEPARWRSLLWALDLGLVLYECLTHIPPSGTSITCRHTLGNCPGMALSSLRVRYYNYSSKWNNPDTELLLRKLELDSPSLQSMEGHLQTSMDINCSFWLVNSKNSIEKKILRK